MSRCYEAQTAKNVVTVIIEGTQCPAAEVGGQLRRGAKEGLCRDEELALTEVENLYTSNSLSNTAGLPFQELVGGDLAMYLWLGQQRPRSRILQPANWANVQCVCEGECE